MVVTEHEIQWSRNERTLRYPLDSSMVALLPGFRLQSKSQVEGPIPRPLLNTWNISWPHTVQRNIWSRTATHCERRVSGVCEYTGTYGNLTQGEKSIPPNEEQLTPRRSQETTLCLHIVGPGTSNSLITIMDECKPVKPLFHCHLLPAKRS